MKKVNKTQEIKSDSFFNNKKMCPLSFSYIPAFNLCPLLVCVRRFSFRFSCIYIVNCFTRCHTGTETHPDKNNIIIKCRYLVQGNIRVKYPPPSRAVSTMAFPRILPPFYTLSQILNSILTSQMWQESHWVAFLFWSHRVLNANCKKT